MRNRLLEHIAVAEGLSNVAERQRAAIALWRVGLQHAAIPLAEWLIAVSRRSDVDPELRPAVPVPDFMTLRKPAEGSVVDLLADGVIAAENLGWPGVSKGFWTQVSPRPATAFLEGDKRPTLHKLLLESVRVRNDAVEGHGLPGGENPNAYLDLVRLLLESVPDLFPTIKEGEDAFTLTAPDRDLEVQFLRPLGGDLVCYRSSRPRGADIAEISAHRLVSLSEREEVGWRARDVLREMGSIGAPRYVEISAAADWKPMCMVPARITGSFTGRRSQLRELEEWIEDTESRACLVYGDGGLGKTTLVVEFLHQLLEGSVGGGWTPDFISFFTAKSTRWGLNGLERISAREVGAADAATHIVRAISDVPLDKSWFDRDPERVIDKAASFLRDEWGVERREHLIVLDNTETMAVDEESRIALARQISLIAKRLGRVILTSRRRERVEANEIELLPLEPGESVQLLRLRGEELKRQPLVDAGDRTLRKYSEKLRNRPLLLEVFLQTLSDESISLERAFDRVQRMQNEDLGEFLFEDAWRRFTPALRHLLLLMTRVSDAHDTALLKLCCSPAKVAVYDAAAGLEESRGIASSTNIDGVLHIQFAPEFVRFCEGRTERIGGREFPSEEAVARIRKRYDRFVRAKSQRVVDRFRAAYRKPFARIAYQAFLARDYVEAEENYELAVDEDPLNGMLFERFANSLLLMGKASEAEPKSERATELLPKSAQTWFTRGRIKAELGDTVGTAIAMTHAEKFGHAAHECFFQRARSYYFAAPASLGDVRLNIEKARRSLSDSTRDDSYRKKWEGEFDNLVRRSEWRTRSNLRRPRH